MHIVTIPLAAILLATSLFAGCLTPPESTADKGPVKTSKRKRRRSKLPPTATEASTDASTTPTPPPRRWTKVLEFCGSAMKQSHVVALEGGGQRIRYESKCPVSMCPFIVYVVPEGTDLMTTGGLPDLMVTEAETGTSGLQKQAGRYYLRVMSNSGWKIVVEEER